MLVAVRAQIRRRMTAVLGQSRGAFDLEQLKPQLPLAHHRGMAPGRRDMEPLFDLEPEHPTVPVDRLVKAGHRYPAMMERKLGHQPISAKVCAHQSAI